MEKVLSSIPFSFSWDGKFVQAHLGKPTVFVMAYVPLKKYSFEVYIEQEVFASTWRAINTIIHLTNYILSPILIFFPQQKCNINGGSISLPIEVLIFSFSELSSVYLYN